MSLNDEVDVNGLTQERTGKFTSDETTPTPPRVKKKLMDAHSKRV